MIEEDGAPKRPKLTHEEGPNGNHQEMPKAEPSQNHQNIAGPSNEQTQPKIFKLDIDCFDEIFEYLSVKDLQSFGRTCKTIQKVAGEYFKRNYSAAETFIRKGAIFRNAVYKYNNSIIIDERTEITGFNEFVTSITQTKNDIKPFRYLRSHAGEFESLKQITFVGLTLNQEKGEILKKIWPKIETMHIKNCWIRGNLYENILVHCTNLKCLYVQQTTSRYFLRLERNVCVPWLHRKYPRLEHLEVIPSPLVKDLNMFFRNNPHVRSLSTNTPSIWYNRVGLLKSNIQLDLLEIKDALGFRPISKTFCNLLIQLHQRGLFKRLNFYTYNIDNTTGMHLATLPVLEKLCLRDKSFTSTGLTNLRELAILDGANSNDMEFFANNLVCLQRVYIGNATIDDVLPFICKAPKVTKIKVIPKDKTHFNGGILKLLTLNKERAKLLGAIKITIYIPDDAFLRTKWATYNGDTNLKFIEIARLDSYEWNQHYF